MSVTIPIASLAQAENLSAQRPDLFTVGKALVQQDESGNWLIFCFDDTVGADIQALDETDARVKLANYSGLKRWTTETAGIMSSGHPIKTDGDSQRKTALVDSNFINGIQTGTVEWKLADGTFVSADAALVHQFNLDIQSHITACYNAEQACYDAIQAGSVTTNADVDNFYASIPILPSGTLPASAMRRYA